MSKKLFIFLFLAFIAATIIGTLSHELGHYIVAKYYGYDARINYAATYMGSYDPNHPITEENGFLITLGGPIQTLTTSTIGLLLLYFFRENFRKAEQLSSRQWIIIFLSLFWLRQTANFCSWLADYLLTGNLSSRCDEIKIANYLQLPNWTVITITGFIGALILYVVIFKFIPKKQRITFMAAGLSGGIVGFIFWLVLFGKYIMP